MVPAVLYTLLPCGRWFLFSFMLLWFYWTNDLLCHNEFLDLGMLSINLPNLELLWKIQSGFWHKKKVLKLLVKHTGGGLSPLGALMQQMLSLSSGVWAWSVCQIGETIPSASLTMGTSLRGTRGLICYGRALQATESQGELVEQYEGCRIKVRVVFFFTHRAAHWKMKYSDK